MGILQEPVPSSPPIIVPRPKGYAQVLELLDDDGWYLIASYTNDKTPAVTVSKLRSRYDGTYEFATAPIPETTTFGVWARRISY